MFLDFANERSYPTPYANSPLLPFLLLSLATQRHSPITKWRVRREYDYVIVGAGSAGSVVANRLSEMECVSVLLLEAGKPPPRLTEIPAIARRFVNTDIDWQYVTAPQKHTAAGLTDRRVIWPSGKTLGGSSTLNAMLYVRGNRRNYDEWAELGATEWSYDEVLPYFKKLEDNTDLAYLQNGYHASGGPITASRPAYYPEPKLAAMAAVYGEGYDFVDPNAFEQVGFYEYQSSTRRGQRCGTAKAYLVPAENRLNLDIVPMALVRKVLIENEKAVGVEFDFRGSTRTVKARKEVILSAGTVNTAQLLMLSGIGPKSELEKHDIPVVANLPVGLNFQDHPVTFLVYELNPEVERFNEEIEKVENILDYIFFRTGPLTASEGVHLMSFLNSTDSSDPLIPDYTVYVTDMDRMFFSQIGLPNEVLLGFESLVANKTTIFLGSQLLRTRSIGSVTLQSSNPYDPPIIDPNYLSDSQDVKDLVQGLKKGKQIVENSFLKSIGAKPLEGYVVPGCEEMVQDLDSYFECIARTVIVTTSHQVGTARMGALNDSRTVVDPQLRVKGINGLRVVDASIMPTIPWSNTNIPTIMVAEKASDIIKETISCGIINSTFK